MKLPVSVANTDLAAGSFVACTGTTSTPCDSFGPIFPYTHGYSVGAGDCVAELATAPVAPTVPGTKATTFGTSDTVPLGLLSVKVVNSTGDPVAGATVTGSVGGSTVTCKAFTVSLGTTGADGSLAVATVDGAYSVTVTEHSIHATTTVQVAPADEIVTTSVVVLPNAVDVKT
jgi:hypothetical protein